MDRDRDADENEYLLERRAGDDFQEERATMSKGSSRVGSSGVDGVVLDNSTELRYYGKRELTDVFANMTALRRWLR